MVSMGATDSRSPIITPAPATAAVNSMATHGSPRRFFHDSGTSGFRMPSPAMAASRRGAPMSDCVPAPNELSKMPTVTTQWCGRPMVAAGIGFTRSSAWRLMVAPNRMAMVW